MAIKTAVVNVTTAGTRVPLGSARSVNKLTIKAKPSNTQNIYLGDITVAAANGFILQQGDILGLESSLDLSTVYIDADVNGEGVIILYDE